MRFALYVMLTIPLFASADDKAFRKLIPTPRLMARFFVGCTSSQDVFVHGDTPIARRDAEVARRKYLADPSNPELRTAYVQAVTAVGDSVTLQTLHEERLAAARWNVLRTPGDADAWLALASATHVLGNAPATADAYRVTAALNPKAREAFAGLLMGELAAKNMAEARGWRDRFVPLVPAHDRAGVLQATLFDMSIFLLSHEFERLDAPEVPASVRAEYQQALDLAINEADVLAGNLRKRFDASHASELPALREKHLLEFSIQLDMLALAKATWTAYRAGAPAPVTFLSDDTLRQKERQMAVDPNDPRGPFCLLAMQNMQELAGESGGTLIAKKLPPERAARQERALRELHRLTEHTDPTVAATALFLEGMAIGMETRDGAVRFRRAVELDPTFDLAWSSWAGYYPKDAREHMLEITRVWCAQHPSVFAFCYRAVMLADAEQWDAVAATYAEALRHHPDDTRLQLGVLGGRLRTVETPAAINALHTDYLKLFENNPALGRDVDLHRDAAMHFAVLYRLAGDTACMDAAIEQLRQHPPTDELQRFLREISPAPLGRPGFSAMGR